MTKAALFPPVPATPPTPYPKARDARGRPARGVPCERLAPGIDRSPALGFSLRSKWFPTVLHILILLGVHSSLPAVIFHSTADPNHNTTAPTGELAGSGWQWVGNWNGFQGTPIGPRHFLTAKHVGGQVGNVLILGGVSYPTVAFFDDAASDLRICEVSGTFPTWAPLYRGSTEAGKGLVAFGRGLTRGAEVRDAFTTTLRGWQWGAGDGRLRWGQNLVYAVADGGSYWGQLLYARFDAGAGANEAHLAVGDSSGPIFIKDGSEWKLAGVAATVDASFNTNETGDGFIAAIFDRRRLYFGNSSNWTLTPNGPLPVPSGFYATRVSIRTEWIDQVLTPAPPATTPLTAIPTMTQAWYLLTGAMLVAAGIARRNRS